MKLAKLLFTVAALGSLIACGGGNGGATSGTEITRNEFLEQTANLPVSPYTEVTVTWDINASFGGEIETDKGTGVFTIDPVNGWSYKSGDKPKSEEIEPIGIKAYGFALEVDPEDPHYPVGVVSKFYKDPFMLTTKGTGSQEITEGYNVTMTVDNEARFDEYGNCIYYKNNSSSKEMMMTSNILLTASYK